MKFSGNAVTLKERQELSNFANKIGANECIVGMKKIDGKYQQCIRFFKDDKLVCEQ